MTRNQHSLLPMWRALPVVLWWGLLGTCLGQGMLPFDLPAPTTPEVPAPAYDPNQFVNLLPGLRTACAPSWVRPGLRVTFYSAASSGGGRDPKGGHGYTQVTVAAMNPNATVLEVRSYGLQGLQTDSASLLIGAESAVSVPGAGSDWWLNPAVLQEVQQGTYGETTVIRGPYTLGGQSYNALRFQYDSEGARSAYVYDLASGVLLHSNSATGGHRKMLTQNTYVGLRYLQLPWMAAAGEGPWPAAFRTVGYGGKMMVLVPGAVSVAMPLTVQAEVIARGPDWMRYRLTSSCSAGQGMPPSTSTSTRVGGLGHIGAIWLPPAALNTLRSGQVIDQDPCTKTSVSVSYVGNGQSGGREVVISEVSQLQRLDYAYNASNGLLVGFGVADPTRYTRTQLRLTGVQ